MSEHEPTLRGAHLGEELRRLRESCGISQASAASHIDVSASKLNRIESGQRNPSYEDVCGLVSICHVKGEHRTELLKIAQEVNQRGWILRTSQAQQIRTLRDLDLKAEQIINFEPLMVPGLLQTAPYTVALMTEVGQQPDDVAQQGLAVRIHRQSVLRKQRTAFVALIAEDALQHRVGGARVLHEQLTYLIEAARHPNISIRVVPELDHGHPGYDGGFLRYRIPDRTGVVAVETRAFTMFLEDADDVRDYDEIANALFGFALDEVASIERITRLATDLEGETST